MSVAFVFFGFFAVFGVFAQWTLPGGQTLPGGTLPGGTLPGGTLPSDVTLPGGTLPGGETLPGGTLPGGETLPGGTFPETLPSELTLPTEATTGTFTTVELGTTALQTTTTAATTPATTPAASTTTAATTVTATTAVTSLTSEPQTTAEPLPPITTDREPTTTATSVSSQTTIVHNGTTVGPNGTSTETTTAHPHTQAPTISPTTPPPIFLLVAEINITHVMPPGPEQQAEGSQRLTFLLRHCEALAPYVQDPIIAVLDTYTIPDPTSSGICIYRFFLSNASKRSESDFREMSDDERITREFYAVVEAMGEEVCKRSNDWFFSIDKIALLIDTRVSAPQGEPDDVGGGSAIAWILGLLFITLGISGFVLVIYRRIQFLKRSSVQLKQLIQIQKLLGPSGDTVVDKPSDDGDGGAAAENNVYMPPKLEDNFGPGEEDGTKPLLVAVGDEQEGENEEMKHSFGVVDSQQDAQAETDDPVSSHCEQQQDDGTCSAAGTTINDKEEVAQPAAIDPSTI